MKNGPFKRLRFRERLRPLTYGLLLCVFLVQFHIPATSAHTFKSDGSISAILHVSSDDKPASGIATSYLFFIHDSAGKFSFSDCHCTVTAKEHGKTLQIQALKVDSRGILNGSINYPKADVYDLILKGNPIQPEDFQPFSFDYLVRVSEGQPTSSSLSILLLGVCALLIIVSIVACWFQFKYNIREGKE